MSGFSREWLALRAPYDARARSPALVRHFARALPPRARLLDLAAGTGANRDWLALRLPASTSWVLADNDPALIEGVPDARLVDLSAGLEAIDGIDGATCSAFLDLVSKTWLERFVEWLGGRPLLAALSVDGRVRFTPDDVEDGAVLAAFAADQRRDKGLGPALGPEAPKHLEGLLRENGYRVAMTRSDWVLGGRDKPMLAAMIESFAAVAPCAHGWKARRCGQAETGRLRLVVGHVDIVAWRG